MGDHEQSRTFEEFYRRYQPVVLRYVMKRFGARDADDVTQEVMTRAMLVFPAVDERDPVPWLRTVAYRVAIDHVRRRTRTPALPADSIAAAVPPQPDEASESAVAGDARRRLRAALHELPQREQDALLLRHVHGYAEAEVGRALGLNANATRQLTFRARGRLRRAYRATGGPERLGALAPATVPLESRRTRWPEWLRSITITTLPVPVAAVIAITGQLGLLILDADEPVVPRPPAGQVMVPKSHGVAVDLGPVRLPDLDLPPRLERLTGTDAPGAAPAVTVCGPPVCATAGPQGDHYCVWVGTQHVHDLAPSSGAVACAPLSGSSKHFVGPDPGTVAIAAGAQEPVAQPEPEAGAPPDRTGAAPAPLPDPQPPTAAPGAVLPG